MNSSERRSSSRSIKRKRFDDEIVDYALPPTVTRVRQRTNSQTLSNLSLTSAPNEPRSPMQTTPAAAPLLIPTISGPINTKIGQTTVTLVEAKATPPPVQLSPPEPMKVIPTVDIKIEPVSAPLVSSTPLIKSVPADITPVTTPPIPKLTQIKVEASSPMLNTPQPPTTIAHDSGGSFTSNVSTGPSAFLEKRLRPAAKRKGKVRGLNQMSTKDLGRWKPVDDLALIIGVQQTNDLKMVHRGTKFSCKFTLNELQNRWYALLYEESISRIAVAAMRNLHPELVENIQRRALFTTQEEDVLGTIKSTESPTVNTFQQLLRKNSSTFYSARTPKSLLSHWQLMKQYCLLPDQALKLPNKDGTILSFSDNEDLLNDAELAEPRDGALDLELALVDRRNKREIRQLENELGRWNVLVDSMTGMGFPPEFDRQTLAVLRGRLVRYLMRSSEITIGRSTKDSTVDVDLGLEGSAFKVSRKQGTIKLRSNADFFLTNEGKRPIYVDGLALLTGFKMRLSHNCAIEIAGLRFTFLVNFDLINAIQQESAKMNNPLA